MRIGIEMAIQFARIEFLTRSKGGDSCRKAAYNARTIEY
ncbi:conjugal transfer protein TraA [Orientia tsutsugamushi]|nr:conjugal transfer protein TraA [Orientia tsutsugamushi]